VHFLCWPIKGHVLQLETQTKLTNFADANANEIDKRYRDPGFLQLHPLMKILTESRGPTVIPSDEKSYRITGSYSETLWQIHQAQHLEIARRIEAQKRSQSRSANRCPPWEDRCVIWLRKYLNLVSAQIKGDGPPAMSRSAEYGKARRTPATLCSSQIAS
jgi:hypothetical protein